MFYEKFISGCTELTISRIKTHQFHKTAQLRLLEIIDFPIKSVVLAMSLLPTVAGIRMQCKGVAMQFEA
jgi:hypothetical protein